MLQVQCGPYMEYLPTERLGYNLLFRWLLGFDMDDPVWDLTALAMNRGWLFDGGAEMPYPSSPVSCPGSGSGQRETPRLKGPTMRLGAQEANE